jgi:hypothetical protein
MTRLKLSPAALAALNQYNLETTGHGIAGSGHITNPETIARLQLLALPDENLNDTIIRLCNNPSLARPQ